jgi:hypothetical protein
MKKLTLVLAPVMAALLVMGVVVTVYVTQRQKPNASQQRATVPESADAESLSSAAPPQNVSLPAQKITKAAVEQSMAKNGWKLTEDVRRTYLQYAEYQVLGEIRADSVDLSDKFVEWVRSEPDVYDAAYGAVYPPDRRILLNIHQLRRELGPKLTEKYKQLIIGAAVTRRMIGVSAHPMERKLGTSLQVAQARETGKVSASKVSPAQAAARNTEKENTVRVVETYLKANRLSAAKAYADPEHCKALMALLNNAKTGRKITDPKRITSSLYQYMLGAGQVPAKRDPFPSVAEYIRYLDNILGQKHKPFKKKKGMSTWPLFPVDKAPWPVLMPLSRTMPLREAQYIWETYNGLHGNNRYHTYGPYRRSDKAGPYRLQPSEWHSASWPSISRVGGLCGTMSSISMLTDTALGKPSLKAGQPGHSCIVLYNRDAKGFYNTSISQGVSSPEATRSAWCFADPKSFGAGMDYHYGLSLAVNKGLRNYMSARIAVCLYKMMPPKHQAKRGVPLLTSAAQINPYHPEIWYLLAGLAKAEQNPPKVIGIFRVFSKAVSASRDDLTPWVERAADQAIEDADIEAPSSVKKNEALYAKIVTQTIIQTVLACPVPENPQDARAILACLDQASSRYGSSVAPLQMKYQVAIDGIDKVKDEVTAYVGDYYAKLTAKPAPRKKGQPKPPPLPRRTAVANRITNVVPQFTDVRKRIGWLEQLNAVHKPSTVIYVYRRQGPRLDEAYVVTYNQLANDYKATKNTAKLNALKKENTANKTNLAQRKTVKK